MRICKVPDANMRFLRGALERLCNRCDPGFTGESNRTIDEVLASVRRTIDDIMAGNPHADCHYRHRANRGMLEIAHDDLVYVKRTIEEAEDGDEEQSWLYSSLCVLLGFDLDTAIEHLSPSALDKWEVEDEA